MHDLLSQAPSAMSKNQKLQTVTLPCTLQQVRQFQQVWNEFQSAKERTELVLSCILAAHGLEKGTFVSLVGGDKPSITISLQNTELVPSVPSPQGASGQDHS